jgi:hypothetical protein
MTITMEFSAKMMKRVLVSLLLSSKFLKKKLHQSRKSKIQSCNTPRLKDNLSTVLSEMMTMKFKFSRWFQFPHHSNKTKLNQLLNTKELHQNPNTKLWNLCNKTKSNCMSNFAIFSVGELNQNLPKVPSQTFQKKKNW